MVVRLWEKRKGSSGADSRLCAWHTVIAPLRTTTSYIDHDRTLWTWTWDNPCQHDLVVGSQNPSFRNGKDCKPINNCSLLQKIPADQFTWGNRQRACYLNNRLLVKTCFKPLALLCPLILHNYAINSAQSQSAPPWKICHKLPDPKTPYISFLTFPSETLLSKFY